VRAAGLTCLVVFVASMTAIAVIFIHATWGDRPSQRAKTAAAGIEDVPEYHSGSFQCPRCLAEGRPVRFLRAGDLMVHEIQDHPVGRT